MAGLQHQKTSAKSDGGDSSLVLPSDWNAEHLIDGTKYRVATSMPGTPGTNDRVLRTDLGLEFYYDGTRWLSTTLYRHDNLAMSNASATTTLLTYAPNPAPGSDIYLLNTFVEFFVQTGGSALDSTHKWVGVIGKRLANNTDETLITVNIASGASGSWRTDSQTINALMNNGTSHYLFTIVWTKTSTPGNLYAYTVVEYRIVGT